MQHVTRRDFLKSTAAAGALATSPGLLRAAEETATLTFKGSDMVPLGQTGIKVSRLAQGTGFNGYEPLVRAYATGKGII